MEIEDDSGAQDLQPRTSLPSRSGKSTMVGLDKELTEILTWMDGDSPALNTLSIVGMAGIGKTTFARKLYDHQRIQETCHVRAWVTVSQNYDERKVLLDLLDSMKKLSGEMHIFETSALKEKLYRSLIGWRYLIVMDDIWDTKVWNDVNRLFPDNNKRSRIILTTRLESVAVHVYSSRSALHQMRFLNDVESWNLFCQKVFGGDFCPGELNQMGTEIVKKCGGLPLAIVLVAGLLSKSTQTQSSWEYVAKNFSSVITSHDDQLSKILYLSYDNLPHHLRACFLYMGIFPEDYEILASKLVKLWIAEGFIEPVTTSKSLEDAAEEYLLNLVERSLISVFKRSSRGKIKKCKIHDLLHEFCVREAKKESFFHVTDRSLCDLPTNITPSHITEKQIMEIEDDSGVQDLQPRTSLPSCSGKSTMVGLDKELIEILTWMDGDSPALNTLSIVGMAGIGKTTFARKLYDHHRIQETCHVRAWATVSKNYDERKILLDLLDSMKKLSGDMHILETSALKEKLYRSLIGWRYLIVMDDIWDTKVWNDVNRLFPDNKKRSQIILTTRLESVAVHVNSSRSALHQMRFLNDVESWNLFCQKVFGGDFCPGELNQMGTEIVKKCGGLPLAIVLVAGLLSKSTQTQSSWEYVARNFSSVITSHDDQLSKILYLSYDNLPHHLRACFLYMGIILEDYEILASELVKLWIAEGFIEPVMRSKTLEDVAEEYLLNLVERSLISVSKRSSRGKIKKCKIHDLLHEFCVREAKKESLFRYLPTDISKSHISEKITEILPKRIVSLRRVSILPNTQTNRPHPDSLPTSTVRSVLNFDPTLSLSVDFLNSSPLRVLDTVNANSFDFPTETVKLNLRYLACLSGTRELLSSMYKLRNLQTLILSCMESSFRLPFEIWRMPQLRHVHIDSVILPDPPVAGVEGGKSLIVLQDLQSLSTVINFKFVEDILGRIPNLKKLGILYVDIREDWSDYYLNNLKLLKNLEALKCLFHFQYQTFLKKIIFPPSLKKLTLRGCFLPWEDMTIVGQLPKLQVLKLKRKAFRGAVWEPKEGEFPQLKFLRLEENYLEDWNAERTHFPILEHLIFDNCQRLKEVPCGIGEILTLKKIELYYCSDSLVTSAKDIYEEQYNSGNEDFQVHIVEMTAEEFETC